MILLITLEFCYHEKQNIFGVVDIQISMTLNCLVSPVVEHNLLAQNITCQVYRDTIKGDRPIYSMVICRQLTKITDTDYQFYYPLGVIYELN